MLFAFVVARLRRGSLTVFDLSIFGKQRGLKMRFSQILAQKSQKLGLSQAHLRLPRACRPTSRHCLRVATDPDAGVMSPTPSQERPNGGKANGGGARLGGSNLGTVKEFRGFED